VGEGYHQGVRVRVKAKVKVKVMVKVKVKVKVKVRVRVKVKVRVVGARVAFACVEQRRSETFLLSPVMYPHVDIVVAMYMF
jgi:hypothetical protein